MSDGSGVAVNTDVAVRVGDGVFVMTPVDVGTLNLKFPDAMVAGYPPDSCGI